MIRNDVDIELKYIPLDWRVTKALEHLYLIEDHFDYPEDISKAIDWLQKLHSGKAVWICKGKGYWEESK